MATRKYPVRVLSTLMFFEAPDNVADVERLTGKNSVIEGFFQQYCFHDRGPELKRRFARKLEEFLGPEGDRQGFKMEKNKKNPDGPEIKRYTESEKEFFDRVFLAGQITVADKDRLLNECNNEIGAWSPGEVSQRKPAAAFYDLAKAAMSRIEGNAEMAAKFISNVESKLGVFFADAYGELNLDNIAKAYRDLDEKARAKAREDALAMFDAEEEAEGEEE